MSVVPSIKNKAIRLLTTTREFFVWKSGDVFIISFPRSGRTWLRVFLAKYISEYTEQDFDISFRNLKRPSSFVSRIRFSHWGIIGQVLEAWRKKKPNFDIAKIEGNAKELSRRERVIFLVRDPRDVVISYYYHLMHARKDSHASEMSLSEFIRNPNIGIEHIIDYMNTWYTKGTHHIKNFNIVRYEDLVQNKESLRGLLRLVGVPANEKIFTNAIAYASFDNMKKLESQDAFGGKYFSKGESREPEASHVRQGKIGGFASYLSAEDVQYVNAVLDKLNPVFGYKKDTK